MAGMRVLQLAKEYGLSNKEMLEKVVELGIPAKSHASPLSDEQVAQVREALGDPAAAGDDGEPAERPLTKEEQEAKEREAEEERARREAVEKERAAREAERAERVAAQGGDEGEDAEASAKARPRRIAPEQSPFAGLENQIESERERVEREAEEARARARAEATARDVAKKQAVEEALRHRVDGKKAAPAKVEEAPVAPKKQAPTAAPASKGFDSLLSQIEAEQKRIEEQGAQTSSGKGKGKGKKKHERGEQFVPELEQADAGEDRYAKMAAQAEKIQKNKVLADARAAVAAASTHEGEAAARSARRSARPKPASAPRWKRSKGVSIPSWCWTSPWSRCRRAHRSPSCPTC